MKITDFLREIGFDGQVIPLGLEHDIAGIVDYSKDVEPGLMFAALSVGDQTGVYIQEALAKGAIGILTSPQIYEKHAKVLQNQNVLIHPIPRLMFARGVSVFHSHQPSHMVAVTGTNGKSSTVHFFRQLARKIGKEAASIGTLGVCGEKKINMGTLPLTTPSPLALHLLLEQLEERHFTHVAMEASSHGLDQYRLHGVKLTAAAFTSFTQDHLDYHASMDDYFCAKLKLFTEVLSPGMTAVLNADIPEYQRLKEVCQKRGISVLSYGKQGQEIQIQKHSVSGGKQLIEIDVLGKHYTSSIELFGEFQVYNMLAALGLMIACGEKDIDQLVRLFPSIEGVDGRMQIAGSTLKGADILVDFAHTPDALENILLAVRQQISGKLWVVFGCGGQRDPLKRPIMGAVASRLADHVIVTDDNPRWEDPQSIRTQVLEGTKNALEIGNRFEAISYVIEKMQKGDLLIVAGKGHETGQIIRDQIIPFNDIDAIKTILRGKNDSTLERS